MGPGITAVLLSCKVAAHLGQSMLSTEDEGPFRRPVTHINCKKSQHFPNLNARLKGKAAPEAKRSPWLIRCEEKSHSLQWLELLGTLNEALVKTALNVSDHRKTPVLHSIVRCLSVRDPSPHEQPCLSYCKITPPPLFSLMPPPPQLFDSNHAGWLRILYLSDSTQSILSMLFMARLALHSSLSSEKKKKFHAVRSAEHVHMFIDTHGQAYSERTDSAQY